MWWRGELTFIQWRSSFVCAHLICDAGVHTTWRRGAPGARAAPTAVLALSGLMRLGEGPGARFQYRRSNMTFRLVFLESLRFGAAPAALQLPSSQLKAPMDGAHWHAQLVA